MKFLACTIKVKNMDDSIKFYKDIVRLPLNQRFQPETGIEMAILGSRETKIELICNVLEENTGSLDGLALCFEVKSLDKMIDFVKENGLSIHSGPFQPNPNIKFVYVLDPNGVKIQFLESL